MPKLSQRLAKQAEEADVVGSFEPLEPGKYYVRLAEVEAVENNNGSAAWSSEFDRVYNLEMEKQPGRQWYRLNLPVGDVGDEPPSWYNNGQAKWDSFQRMSQGRLHAFFDAFGYTTDSDTDEMRGEWAVASISQRTIQQGARAGRQANQVDGLEAVPDDFEAPEDAPGSDDY